MNRNKGSKLLVITVLALALSLLGGPQVLAGTFGPVTVTDQTPTTPLTNPVPSSYQPRYISGFGSDGAFTVFFEDRDAGGAISYASTTSGPTGFPASTTLTNIADTHFCVKDWPITIGVTTYAYRAWASVGNNMDHHFYVSHDLANWTLISTFTIPNAASFTDAHGWVYYGFHDVILLNGTYYAFAESNQSQTMLVRSANGDDVWEAFASIGGRPGWGPLELPSGVSYGWTPSGNFLDLGHDRGYGKIHVDPRDSHFYLAVNTAAKPSLAPADLEAAFINPANWTWHDGTTGPAANPILSATTEHDLRECWVVPNTDPDADWVIIYDADFGSTDGGKALGYATLTPPPIEVWVDDDYNQSACTSDGHTWQVDCFDKVEDGVSAVAAGGTVNVAAGTYTPPATVNIDKPLTMLGPQAGVEPRPSCGSTRIPGDTGTEAIVDGGGTLSRIFRITADDVILDGLEIRNATGDMLDSPSGAGISNIALRYNIIRDALGDEGVQLRDCADCVVEYNHVFNIAQDGINLCCGSTGGYIQYNEVHNNSSENAAIYVYGAEHMTIQCNLVYDVLDNDGIKLGSKGGGDAGLSGGSILYNTVHNTAQDGISVYTSDTVVQGNEVYYSSSENGAIYVAWEVSNIDILYNDVHDNTLNTGKWGDPGAIMIGTDVDASDVLVNYNNIYANSPNGLTNKATAPLDATSNWWGAADGPSGEGAGSGDAVSTNVDFASWLSEPQVIVNPCIPDTEGPVTTDVAATPNPVAVAGLVDLTANVDDTATGGSNIASAEYTLDDGANWYPMDADPFTPEIDGFDSPTEDVAATFTAPGVPGIYDLCVRGTDEPDNTGGPECIMLVVYDPDGGFVTGGGWIDSPPEAYKSSDPVDIGGTFTGDYYTRFTDITCNPNESPVTFTGWVEATGIDTGGAVWLGLIDKDWFDSGDSAWGSGAAVYLGHRTAQGFDGISIGPTDGFMAGELVQTFDHVPYVAGGPNRFDFSMEIYNGQITVNYDGADYVDTYGEIEDANTYDAYPWSEFDFGAYVGIDGWPTDNSVDYDISITGCETGVSGKATFGFVSKYKKGASEPTGNTEFVFKAADLNFHSTSYDWLIVTGSDYARFKGSGSINGMGDYRFMLWAGDGEPDTFRIKIWWEDETEHVVYDNGSDQAIAGGQIVIHTKNK